MTYSLQKVFYKIKNYSLFQSVHRQLVPVAEACGCFDVPVLPSRQTLTTGSEYQTVRDTNMPMYSAAIQNQYANIPITGKRITRVPRMRKLTSNQVANTLDLIYNVPKSKYVKMSNKNLAQINELNNLKYRIARLAEITRSTAELLSTLPVASNRYMKNTYSGYTLPVQDMPMTGTPVYRSPNVYDTNNGFIEFL